jgi:hypothetical protein
LLFVSWFFTHGLSRHIKYYTEIVNDFQTLGYSWREARQQYIFVAFCEELKETYTGVFYGYLAYATHQVSQKRNDGLVIVSSLLTKYGCSAVGQDIMGKFGFALPHRTYTRKDGILLDTFMTAVDTKMRTELCCAWLDNFSRWYFLNKYRDITGNHLPANFTVCSYTFTIQKLPTVPFAYQPDGAVLPCLPDPDVFFSLAAANDVERQIYSVHNDFRDGFWVSYYDTSPTVREGVFCYPAKPVAEEAMDKADPARKRGLHCPYEVLVDNCSSTVGWANVVDWASDHMQEKFWRHRVYSFCKADVDLFMKELKKRFGELDIHVDWYDKTCILFAPWHADKMLTKRMYECHFPTIIGPLLRILIPGKALSVAVNHQTRVAQFASLLAAYNKPGVRARFQRAYTVFEDIARAETLANRRAYGGANSPPAPPPLPDNLVARHVWMFFEYFLPLVSTYSPHVRCA